jgi:hypothetical protein
MDTKPKIVYPKFTITVVCNVKPICLDNLKKVSYCDPPIININNDKKG